MCVYTHTHAYIPASLCCTAEINIVSQLYFNNLKKHYQLCVCVHAKLLQSCPTLRPYGLQPTRLFCPLDSPSKSTGVGCHFLLQGIFSLQRLNSYLLCLLRWQAGSIPLVPPRKPLTSHRCKLLFDCWLNLNLNLSLDIFECLQSTLICFCVCLFIILSIFPVKFLFFVNMQLL